MQREAIKRRAQRISFVGVILALSLMAESASTLEVADFLQLNPGGEDRFYQLINESRGANGLPGLGVDGNLVVNARSHSGTMASQGTIFHNGALASQVPGGWAALGENVGVGGSVDSLHGAFMNSPGHRANVLGDYDRMGVGIVMSGSTTFVTEVFWKTAGAPPVASASSSGGGAVAAPAGGTTTVLRKRCRFVRGRRKCTVVRKKVRRVTRRRRRRR
jgi:hypothetical protein